MPLRTIIVEDEPLSQMYLSNLLTEAFPDICITATATTEDDAVEALSRHNPDIVFMDIELQAGSGFGVVNRVSIDDMHIIFTTALDEHATALLRLSGVPYIQKPIDLDSLSAAVMHAQDIGTKPTHSSALDQLRATMRNNNMPLSILLQCNGGEEMRVTLKDIVAINATEEGSCASLFSGDKVTCRSALKELDNLLKDFGFFRAHMQHVINLRHVSAISEARVSAMMRNNMEIPVSPKRLAELRSQIGA